MDQLVFIGGSTFLVNGSWTSGAAFSVDTTVTAVVNFNNQTTHTLVVYKTLPRAFQLYAPASATALWPKGTHSFTLTRSDPGLDPAGATLVEILESSVLEVK